MISRFGGICDPFPGGFYQNKTLQPQEEMKDADAELEPWEDSEVFEVRQPCSCLEAAGAVSVVFVEYFHGNVMVVVHKCLWFVSRILMVFSKYVQFVVVFGGFGNFEERVTFQLHSLAFWITWKAWGHKGANLDDGDDKDTRGNTSHFHPWLK